MILLLILLILLLLFIWKSLSIDNFEMDHVGIDDFISRSNTGDIIGVSYKSVTGNLVNLFSNSYWTHLGMVIKSDNLMYCEKSKCGIYIFEVCYYRSFRGVHFMSLEEFMRKNGDFEISYVSLRGDKVNNDDLFKIYERTKSCDINLFIPYWMITLIKQKYRGLEEQNTYFCSEFIMMLLHELNIAKKKNRPCNHSPNEIMLSMIELEHDYMYDMPKRIISSSSF
jgi:hypothetical protein